MKRIYLTIIIVFIHFVSSGQIKEHSKNLKVAEKLVGTWKFDHAQLRVTHEGVTSINRSKIFHIDTLHFFEDMTFRFNSQNADKTKTDSRVHTGSWAITNKGHTLVLKNREAFPPFEEETPDINFPIRVINYDRIRIDFIVYMVQGVAEPMTIKTPVYFDRFD